jgi:RNA polymerase sigma-70 factor (ECF subfamily)
MDRLRARYAEPATVALHDVDIDVDLAADEASDLADDILTMHEELNQLPLLEREVLVLFYLRELTLAELAEVLSVPVGTIKSRLFRARHSLRTQLEGRGVRP